MKSLNAEEIKERLAFILDKEELSIEEMRWLLNYLEQTEGREFCEILYEFFQQNSTSENRIKYKKAFLVKIREKVYEKLFGK